MKDNLFNDKQQAIYSAEQELRSHCENFDNLTLNQKLCLLLSKNLNPYGNTDLGRKVIFYMEKLLSDGANLNYADEYGKTPLDIALGYRNATSVLWLVEKGAADHLNPSQTLCMLLSTKHSMFDKSFKLTLEKLLQKGADVNYSDCYSKTPIEISIDQNNAETVLWLADNGAKISDNGKKYLNYHLHNHLNFIKNQPIAAENPFLEKLVRHLVHNEIENNLENCTIHKLALFQHSAVKRYITEGQASKAKIFLKTNFFKLIGVCEDQILSPDMIELTFKDFKLQDCLQILGDNSPNEYGELPLF